MLETYFKHEEGRKKQGIPALPLDPYTTKCICKLMEEPPEGKGKFLLHLLENRVSPGVDPAAKIKASFLEDITKGKIFSPVLSKKHAVNLLGTMLGGYNIYPLISLLDNNELAIKAAAALKNIILVYNAFDTIVKKAKKNEFAQEVLSSWAEGEWFLSRPEFPKEMSLKVYKVEGEINTDDFSPAKHAWSRSDIPLHALSLGGTNFPEGRETIKNFRDAGHKVVFVGDVVGTGSSRKSATNSLLWHIGEDISFIPNKRREGIVLGGLIAPIFFNTLEDSGGLPIICDVSHLQTGDLIKLNMNKKNISDEQGNILAEFKLKPSTLLDEYRAGGRLFLIIGRTLTNKARNVLGLSESDIFKSIKNPEPKENQEYSLAQKIAGKACRKDGILPGTACEPEMTTVGSQDTTGPMTADELKELACLEFQCGLFMQSFCHTAAYPKLSDVEMHRSLAKFIVERKGVAIRPEDGVIHAWLNRLLLPDTMGTAGDSHTRFPLGLSFPAGSGLVAFAGALGFIPLNMPESVLVIFSGQFNPGITLRDAVNAIPYYAIKKGLLNVAQEEKKNIFNGRIIEMEGLPEITVEQAYELTDATAERSAAGGTIALSKSSITSYLNSNIVLMKKMIDNGVGEKETLEQRITACEEWLENPVILKRDKNADYAAVLEIDLRDIKEPILACPNDPDDVKLLSEVAKEKIDEVFIGSCMTNIGHFRAAGKVFENAGYLKTRVWLTPPTKMDRAQLKREGYYSIFSSIGARTEIPGCSLCMGNQARVRPGSYIISTSTRNFDDRMGDGAQVYLGSAELAAITALSGKLPTPEEYFAVYKEKIQPYKEKIYKYLQFDKMKDI